MIGGDEAARAELSGADERRMTAWLAPRIARRPVAFELGLYVVAAVLGWWVRSVQDDAFISFRYSANLAEGRGLVFNPGERVEGYTNFLWTLLMSVPERFGWDTPTTSVLVSVPLMVATVAVALRLARRVFRDDALAWLAAAVLLANMTFLAYGTTGLETMLQTFLVTSVAALLLRGSEDSPVHAWQRVGAGFLGGLAVLTRLDSSLLVAAWALVHLWPLRGRSRTTLLASAAQVGLPVLVVVLPWLWWKYGYYGDILPNTLRAKSEGNPLVPVLYGVFYLLAFFASYGAFLLIGRWRRHRHELFELPAARPIAAVVGVWFLYICAVGADFMEFRFVVPVLPLLALPAAFLVDRYRSRRAQVALVAVLLLISAVHRVVPTILPYPVLSISELQHWPSDAPGGLVAMGEVLAREFPGGLDAPGQPVLAVIPVGAAPYYSELPTIDMLGLNDREVAEEGLDIPLYFPGHVRVASVDLLVRRGANLLIGAGRQTTPVPDRESYRLSELVDMVPGGDLNRLPSDATVIELPMVGHQNVWKVVYLTPNELVDAAIERNGWRVVPIEHVCEPDDIPALSAILARRTCPDV